MQLRNTLICLVSTLCLTITLVGIGLVACLIPLTTTALANLACQTSAADSAFTAQQLAYGAQATREYTVGNHDLNQLMLAEATINVELHDQDRTRSPLSDADATTLRRAIDAKKYGESPDYLAVSQILNKLDERFALDSVAISHLDDVFYVVQKAEVALGFVGVIALIGMLIMLMSCRKPFAGIGFVAAGGLVLVAFASLGIWAALDFYNFFNLFHSLFFAGGSWLFSYDSLLICMLPEPFWMGMGALWLIVTVALSVACLVKGIKVLQGK